MHRCSLNMENLKKLKTRKPIQKSDFAAHCPICISGLGFVMKMLMLFVTSSGISDRHGSEILSDIYTVLLQSTYKYLFTPCKTMPFGIQLQTCCLH